MRTAGMLSTLLLAWAPVLGQGAAGVHRVAEIGFDNLYGAWTTVQESSFGRKLAASGWLDRVGVNRHKAQARAALVQAETHLGMPLAEPLNEVLRGKGVLVIAEENGEQVFALDLAPAGLVPFRALCDRLIARDSNVVKLGEESVGGRAFERIRVKEKELLVRIEENRLIAGDSRALLAGGLSAPGIAPGACVKVRFFPGSVRALPGHRDDPPLPFTRIDCALRATGSGIALSGEVELTDEGLLAPFARAGVEPPSLFGLLPEGGMAFALLRTDLKALHALVESLAPPEERELLRRRTTGISYTALGGHMLPDVLAGLGPDVLLAVAGLEGVGEPAGFALLTTIRTKEAHDAMCALGRAVYGVAALGNGDARKEEGERLSFFTGKLGALPVTFGIRDDLVCVSTSEAMARAVCSREASPREGGSPPRLAGHLALGVDTVALAEWLRRNKVPLSQRPTWRQGFRRPDEIEAAAEFASVLRYASFVAAVNGAAVQFAVELDFAKP